MKYCRYSWAANTMWNTAYKNRTRVLVTLDHWLGSDWRQYGMDIHGVNWIHWSLVDCHTILHQLDILEADLNRVSSCTSLHLRVRQPYFPGSSQVPTLNSDVPTLCSTVLEFSGWSPVTTDWPPWEGLGPSVKDWRKYHIPLLPPCCRFFAPVNSLSSSVQGV